jgi:hypothetical protein
MDLRVAGPVDAGGGVGAFNAGKLEQTPKLVATG